MPTPPAATSASARAIFLTHPIFRERAFGKLHPLSIPRHGAVIDLCSALGWLSPAQTAQCPLPDIEALAAFHDRDYLAAFQRATEEMAVTSEIRQRYNLGTMECPLFPGLWERARASVGGAILAAELALGGKVPLHAGGGTHHGSRARASGFCYFNDPVFAILTLLQAGLTRVLYVDLDAHHGDGVEDGFADDPRVMTISIHEADRWPGTGKLEDRRAGNARNMPVPRGLNDSEFKLLVADAVLPLTARFAPEAIVVTCGVDALAGDPLSAMAISNNALADAVMDVISLAPVKLVLGGGGYNPWTLSRGWTGVWGRLNDYRAPAQLPPAAQELLAGFTCDLVDDEDINPNWMTQLWDDAPLEGKALEVRDEIGVIIRTIMA